MYYLNDAFCEAPIAIRRPNGSFGVIGLCHVLPDYRRVKSNHLEYYLLISLLTTR